MDVMIVVFDYFCTKHPPMELHEQKFITKTKIYLLLTTFILIIKSCYHFFSRNSTMIYYKI